MGVFKEHATAFETVAKQQRQIFNDACDYGYPYKTSNPPQEIKDLIMFVKDLKGTSVFRIGWEIDEGMECGQEYTITFCSLKAMAKKPYCLVPECDAFISVDSIRYKEPHKSHKS